MTLTTPAGLLPGFRHEGGSPCAPAVLVVLHLASQLRILYYGNRNQIKILYYFPTLMTLDVLSLVTSVHPAPQVKAVLLGSASQFSSLSLLFLLGFCRFCRDRAFSHSLLMMASSSPVLSTSCLVRANQKLSASSFSSLLRVETFIVIN